MWSRRAEFVLAGMLLGACGPTIPKELVNARNAYSEMLQGPASNTVPEEARQARESLRVAEHSFDDEGASDRTRQLATIAESNAVKAQSICAQRGVAQITPAPR